MLHHATVAQSVERKPEELRVAGSTPAGGTIKSWAISIMVVSRLRKPWASVRIRYVSTKIDF